MLAGTSALATNMTTAGNAATELAKLINNNTSVHGAVASSFNELTSLQKATFTMSETFKINGDLVEIATSQTDLVRLINRDVSEVTAALNTDGTITLSNDNGDDIVIENNGGGGATLQGAVDVGFLASLTSPATLTGFIKLENLNGSPIKIEAANIQPGYSTDVGTIADLQALGFNEVNDDKSISSGTVTSNAITTAHDIKINDVAIGVSSAAYGFKLWLST